MGLTVRPDNIVPVTIIEDGILGVLRFVLLPVPVDLIPRVGMVVRQLVRCDSDNVSVLLVEL